MNMDCMALLNTTISALPVIGALLLIPQTSLRKCSGMIGMFLIVWGFMGNAAFINYKFQPIGLLASLAPLLVGVILSGIVAYKLRFL
jgi:hypothetical protein